MFEPLSFRSSGIIALVGVVCIAADHVVAAIPFFVFAILMVGLSWALAHAEEGPPGVWK